MKKSKIYASVALAALLAGCSNEDFISNEQTSGLEGRPMTKVELAFDEADTRLDWAKPEGEGWQWTFQDGDKIGALLMDDWKQDECGEGHFVMTDYVHTNYPFVRTTKDGKTTWNTPEDAAVCEGNYFFYFPYDKTFTHRGLVGWSINPYQLNYDPETGEYFPMQAIKDNQKWLGYKFIEHQKEGINKVNFDFVPLFATPKFVLENMTGFKLQIERLVIRDNSDNTVGAIDPLAKSDLIATSAMLAPKTGNFAKVNEKTWDGMNFGQHTANMWVHALRYPTNFGTFAFPDVNSVMGGINMDIKATSNIYDITNPAREFVDRKPTYEYTVDFGDNYWVNAGDDVIARAVMPGGQYETEKGMFEAILYVKLENGKRKMVRIDLGDPQTNGGVLEGYWDDILADAASNNMKPGIMNKYQATFDANALKDYTISDTKVASTHELKWVLQEAAKNTGTKDLLVTTFGDEVEMDKEVYDLLAAHPQIRMHVHGIFTLAEGLPEDAINKLYFFGKEDYAGSDLPKGVRTELYIKSKQVANKWHWIERVSGNEQTSNKLEYCEIHVEKPGYLDTKKNGIDVIADVYNAGSVNAGKIEGNVYNKGDKWADTVIGDIENSGNITVRELVDGNVVNDGNAEIASTTGTIKNNKNMTLLGGNYDDVTENFGIMVVKGKSDFKSRLENNAQLFVNADATGIAGSWFINWEGATATIADNVKVCFDWTDNYEEATIYVGENAILKSLFNTKSYDLWNHPTAKIFNKGTMHHVVNDGYIQTGVNSTTNVNDGEGIVDNSAMGEVSYNKEQTVQFIVPDVTGIALETLQDNVKKADANQLIIKSGKLAVEDNFDFNGGSIESENRGYFAMGVIFENVNVYAPMGKRLVLHTNGFFVNGKTDVENGEFVVYQEPTVGTTTTVSGELKVHNYGIFRGGKNAKMEIKWTGEGMIHNQGTVKYIDNYTDCVADPSNHWTGHDAEN